MVEITPRLWSCPKYVSRNHSTEVAFPKGCELRYSLLIVHLSMLERPRVFLRYKHRLAVHEYEKQKYNGPSGFVVDMVKFFARESHRARPRVLRADSRAPHALVRR